MKDATRDRFLTAGWNNVLTLVMGLLFLALALVALTSETFSDRTTFIGLVVAGAFY